MFEAFSDVSLERLVLAFLVSFPAWFRLSFRLSFEAFEKGANAWYTVKTDCFSCFFKFHQGACVRTAGLQTHQKVWQIGLWKSSFC